MSTPSVACPICGGAIHPIAGRCRHCKTDLVSLKARAHSAPPMPVSPAAPTHQRVPPGSVPYPTGAPHRSHSAADYASAPQSSPTTRHTPNTYVGSTWSRRWPMLVVGIATAAIVTSVVLLILQSTAEGSHNNVKTSQARPSPRAVPDTMPTPTLPQPQRGTPAPPPQTQPSPPKGTGPIPRDRFLSTVLDAACERMSACGVSDHMTQTVCHGLGNQLDLNSVMSSCNDYNQSAATSCLRAIKKIPCATGTNPMQLFQDALTLSACVEVCR